MLNLNIKLNILIEKFRYLNIKSDNKHNVIEENINIFFLILFLLVSISIPEIYAINIVKNINSIYFGSPHE